MRRRLMLVIVGTVVVIILAAGAGTWILAAQSTRTAAVSQVLASARKFPTKGGSGELSIGSANLRTSVLKVFTRIIIVTARLNDARLLPIRNGAVPQINASSSVVPSAIVESIASAGVIGARSAVAGSTGSVAWAAEAVAFSFESKHATGTRSYVLVLTRDIGSSSLSGDFLILGGAVIAFAIVMSLALSRRITRPLRRAVTTTQRIAAGDLDARVGVQPGDIPELSSLANSIDAMAEALGRLRHAERQFLLSVSHELRTPLTSIRGYSEAILDGTASEPTHAAAVIGNEARRLERLVGDLLDLTKLDTQTFSFHFRTIDVAEVVDEVAEELRPVVDTAGLRLSVEAPDRQLFVRVDPDRLDQVLANLVENAAKYARTSIRLGTVAYGSEAWVIVEDDGPGIGPDEINRIFERHYSTDRHARPGRPRGSGLGLAIASELSVAMGATVGAQSPTGDAGGTRMIVRLPAVTPSQNPHISNMEP